MLFSRQQQTIDDWPKITLNKTGIPFTPLAKSLGVWFDERLSWTHHTNKTCNAINGSISRLRKIAWSLPESTRLRLVRSLVIPILSYGSTIYGSHNRTNRAKLQKALNTCTRFVYGLRMSDHLRHYSSKILGCSLNQHLDFAILKQLVTTIHHGEPSFLSSRLISSTSRRTNGLVPLRNRHAAYDGMFFIRGVKLWNKLPYDVRQMRNPNKMISAIKLTAHLWDPYQNI